MSRSRAVAVLLGMCISTAASAQDFAGYRPPMHQRALWGYRVLEVGPDRIIYQPGAEVFAERTALALAAYRPVNGDHHGQEARPVSVVVYGDYATPNGFVSPMPYHSGFYAMGFTTRSSTTMLHGIPWVDSLAVHEGRHLVQATDSRKGFSAALFALLGPTGEGVSMFVSVPNWVWEGDAVFAETAYTRAGRGRVPGFSLPLDLALADRDNLRLADLPVGSSRRDMPNHYVYGYHFITAGARAFEPDTLALASERAAAWSFVPFTYGWNFKRQTGTPLRHFARDTLDQLRHTFEAQRAATPITPARALEVPTAGRFWSDLRSPRILQDGSVVGVFDANNSAPELVRIAPDGTTTSLASLPSRTTHVSAASGLACFEEVIPHLRVTMASTSRIRCVSTDGSGTVLKLDGGRLTTPAVHPDGTHIAALDLTPTQQMQVVVFHATTGERLHALDLPSGHRAADLEVQPDGSLLFIETTLHHGDRIMHWTPGAPAAEELWAPGFEVVWQPRLDGHHLFYGSAHSGVSALWVRDLTTHTSALVAARPHGVYRYDIRDERVVFEEPAVGGTGLSEVMLNPSTWTPRTEVPDVALPVWTPDNPAAAPFASASPDAGRLVQISSDAPADRAYRLRDGARFLGWAPFVSARSDLTREVGASATAADLLGLWQAEAAAGYDRRMAGPVGRIRLVVPVLPVIPELRLSHEPHRSATSSRSNSSGGIFGGGLFQSSGFMMWTEQQVGGALTLPLQLPSAVYSGGLDTYVGMSRRWWKWDGDLRVEGVPETSDGRTEVQVGTSFTALRTGRTVGRRGIEAAAELVATPFGGPNPGTQWGVRGTGYLPGVAKAHTLSIWGGLQHRAVDSYSYATMIQVPHNYLTRPEGFLTSGRLDYDAPVWFVDRGTALVGVSTVSMGIFAEGVASDPDQVRLPIGASSSAPDWMAVVGGRVTADVVPMRSGLRLRAGLEVGRQWTSSEQELSVVPVLDGTF